MQFMDVLGLHVLIGFIYSMLIRWCARMHTKHVHRLQHLSYFAL